MKNSIITHDPGAFVCQNGESDAACPHHAFPTSADISRWALAHGFLREPDASAFRLIGYKLIGRSPFTALVPTQGGGAATKFELPLGCSSPLPLVAQLCEKVHDLGGQ